MWSIGNLVIRTYVNDMPIPRYGYSTVDELAAIEAKPDADLTLVELRRAFRLMMKLQGFTRQ